MRSWAGLCVFALIACSDEGGGIAEGPATSGGAGGTSSGGTGVADAPFGGTGGSAVTGGGAGSPATGGAATGGSAGTTDAAVEAAFVCDVSGPLDCSASGVTEYACGDPAAKLAGKVGNAVKSVLAAHPEWFDYSTGYPCCPTAKEPGLFMDAVVAAINANGACAQKDPNNPVIEMVVKLNNKCSENWVILTSAMVVRNPPKYQVACAPAWL